MRMTYAVLHLENVTQKKAIRALLSLSEPGERARGIDLLRMHCGVWCTSSTLAQRRSVVVVFFFFFFFFSTIFLFRFVPDYIFKREREGKKERKKERERRARFSNLMSEKRKGKEEEREDGSLLAWPLFNGWCHGSSLPSIPPPLRSTFIYYNSESCL